MNGHQPHTPDAVIHRLRATLTQRAGDHTITPAFTQRVQRLRRRRHLTLRAAQTTAVLAVVAVAAAGIYQSLRPTRQLEFISPPPATASPTPSPAPSPSPSDDTTPTEQTSAPTAQTPTPAAQEGPSSPPVLEQREPDPGRASAPPDGGDTAGGESGDAEPPPTRVILNGAPPRPGRLCRVDSTTLHVTIDLPEYSTALYVIDRAAPVTMRLTDTEFTDPTDVSDTVDVVTSGDEAIYTATFDSDADDFGLLEVRVEGPADPPPC